MLEILRKYRLRLILILLATLVEMAFNSMVPLSLRYMIDDGLTPHNYRALVTIVVALGVGAVAVSATGLGRDFLFSKTQNAVLADLRELMFNHLQRVSIAFHSRLQAGDVLSRFANDLSALENALVMAIPWAILPGMEAVISSILLFLLDWRLALITMVLWPWTFFASRPASRHASQASHVRKEKESQLLSRLAENLAAQPLVRAFNLQSAQMMAFRNMNQEVAQSSTRASFYSSVMERSTTSGILVIQVSVLGLSCYMAFHGKLSIGTMVSFQGLLLMLSNALLYVMQYTPALVQANTGFSRIQELLRESPAVVDLPGARELQPFAQAIQFQDVDFSYDGNRLNLEHVNLHVPCGANVAFVGGSGSGKSTALALLMRFYDPKDGTIVVDGVLLPHVTYESFRSQTGVVFQESFLFNTTVRENIRAGKATATDLEVEDAAKAAEIHDAIMKMPDGYETVVGDRGGRLSGGQRQRIAIARALVREPRILLLDEATSALDPATEASLNHTLQKLSGGRTVISVTHRLASVVEADGIFVFAAGRIVESGTHTELLAKQGQYASLWAKQTGFSFAPDTAAVSVTPDRLRAIPVLADLEQELLAATARLCVPYTFQPGAEVFRQGEPGDKFYLIVRGRFEILQHGEAVATLEDGDCFGEIALITDAPRNATVRSVNSSTCLALDRVHFQDLLRRSPQTQARILALVQRRT